MKIKCLLSVFIVFTFVIQGFSEDNVTVRSKVEEATVFLQGAQVSRSADISLPAGGSNVVVEALPANIDFSSIRVAGKGEFRILSVNHAINREMLPEHLDEIEALKDSLEYFKNRIEANQAIYNVYRTEQATIFEHFKPLADQSIPLKVDEISAMADFMRSRLKDIKLKQLEINSKIDKDKKEHDRINRNLSKKQVLYSRPSGEVHIQVHSPSSTKGSLKIMYNTRQAGWKPVYDLRAVEAGEPLDLQVKANAYQNTGEEWENVKLTFSTGQPHVPGQKPSLAAWFLRFQPEYTPVPAKARMERSVPAEEVYYIADEEEPVVIGETMTTVEYAVKQPWNISSGSGKKLVDLINYRIPAVFEYHCVPKINNRAFLIAKVSQWQDYRLLPGKASLFFEDTYVGESFIDPDIVDDTLELSLGHDAGITVSRERLTEHVSRSLFGGKKTETVAWEITARNNKKQDIALVIFDQMPVSTHRDIEIELKESSGADINERTGMLTWRFELKPAESEKLSMKYSVTYPRDKQVILE